MVQKFMVEKSGVVKFMVKKSGLNGPGLKLGVEKSGVEMSFNHCCIRCFPTDKTALGLCISVLNYRQSNMHCIFDFCPEPARKETNVPCTR